MGNHISLAYDSWMTTDILKSPSQKLPKVRSPLRRPMPQGQPSLICEQASAHLAVAGEAAASGGASEGREGAADEASCWGALLLPAGPAQVLGAGVPEVGSGRAAAVPFAGGLATPRISAVPCGSSGVP